MKSRENYKTYSILAKDHYENNDTWETGRNNNTLIIGPSGAGKTRSYVMPNILQANTSMIISDTKGVLYQELGPVLRDCGYRVLNLDFTNLESSCGYNPMSFIRYDRTTGRYNEQDILKLTACLVPQEDNNQPFWDLAARMVMNSLVGYVLEALPQRQHTLEYVYKVFNQKGSGGLKCMMEELTALDPDSFAVSKYNSYRVMGAAEKMEASIWGILAEKLDPLIFKQALALYSNPRQINFARMGREKTALFLTISDVDRSMDRLANLFWTQALQELCRSADQDYPDHMLPIPVRMYLDDFAANIFIEDFDKIISVIRSREIYVSVILQSLAQLNALYGEARASTIVGNCDQQLVLGVQDMETARFFAEKCNRTPSTLLNMPLKEAYLFTRGEQPQIVEKFDVSEHKNYRRTHFTEERNRCGNQTEQIAVGY